MVGNRLYLIVHHDGNKVSKVVIKLHLVNHARPRNLGWVEYPDRIYHVDRNSTKHLFRAGNAYGFNADVLKDADLAIKYISLRLTDQENKVYKFPKALIDEHGRYYNFNKQGFEIQRFISVELIKRYNI
jgi:hypothetical protein